MTALLDAALALANAGCSVVPTRADGSKAPAGSWQRWQAQRPSDTQILTWLDTGTYDGIGIVTGAVSGEMEMLEFEGRAQALITEITELADASGLGDVWQSLLAGYLESTPSGGLHILYRVNGGALGNTKLARGEDGLVLIETRGEGGYVIVHPSNGRTHPSGKGWQLLRGGPATIPTISVDERDAIFDLCRMLDAMPTPEVAPLPTAGKSPIQASGDRPGDDYNNRATWDELLTPEGWTKVYARGGVTYWRRPGKTQGISATTGRNDADNLYVFTSSTTFEQEKPYSKFGAFTHLHHGNDYRAASRELRARGYGKDDTWAGSSAGSSDIFGTTTSSPSSVTAAPGTGHVTDATSPSESEPSPPERTSWWPRDLTGVIAGHETEPPPTILYRDDDQALFYAGKVNGLIGESESGKTWVALVAVLQKLRMRERVIYLDFEDTAPGIVSRLRDMGATDDDLAWLTYIGPDEGLHMAATQDLRETLADPPQLVVVDGFNAAMTLLGLDLNSNTDATKFAQQLLKPLSRTGAGVIYVDHVPKNAEQRGKGGIGAQAKRAMTTGCALSVEVSQAFGRGQAGKLKLNVDKDRPGHVRAGAIAAKWAGVAHLTPVGDGLEVTIRPSVEFTQSDNPGEYFRPKHLMQNVSIYLASRPDGATQNDVEKDVKGKGTGLRAALHALRTEEFVEFRDGRNHSVRAYFESSDPLDEHGKPVDPLDD